LETCESYCAGDTKCVNKCKNTKSVTLTIIEGETPDLSFETNSDGELLINGQKDLRVESVENSQGRRLRRLQESGDTSSAPTISYEWRILDSEGKNLNFKTTNQNLSYAVIQKGMSEGQTFTLELTATLH
jgi:hypothetical protein